MFDQASVLHGAISDITAENVQDVKAVLYSSRIAWPLDSMFLDPSVFVT